ncbi:MAG: glycosyltransferase family 1 protein [Rhodospirillales bacterium]
MRILIVSDAWFPQINGVVRTIHTLCGELEKLGHTVRVFGPVRFRTLPCATYPEIRLALWPFRHLTRLVGQFNPQAIHIATEGPLGLAARRYCLKNRLPFTTAYHTRFPEYVFARFRFPLWITYRLLRWFHGRSSGIMVATPSIELVLREHGFRHIRRWSRGVDTALFHPRDKDFLPDRRPVALYVGRVAIEKNIEAFLKLDFPGTKIVVGDGPQLAHLKRKYPAARFTGAKTGEELAAHYAAADVFVFPSRTDTFGLTLLESLASGVPVAAYPVPGPLDVIAPEVGCLDEDLAVAVHGALSLSPKACRAYAVKFSWENCARQFLGNLQIFGAPRAGKALNHAAGQLPISS